jgi:hypothetical protein
MKHLLIKAQVFLYETFGDAQQQAIVVAFLLTLIA